jgi:hypothetical protein
LVVERLEVATVTSVSVPPPSEHDDEESAKEDGESI